MYFVYLVTLLIVPLHLIDSIAHRQLSARPNLITFTLLCFLISQIISTLLSVDPHTSIFGYYSRLNGGLTSLIAYSLLYIVLAIRSNPVLVFKIINATLTSGFIISVYGILQHFGIDRQLWVQDVQARVFATFGQPNWLASYLGVLLLLAGYQTNQSCQQKKLLKTFIYGLFFFSFSLCLVFTKSQSGLIAAIVSLFIFCLATACLPKTNNSSPAIWLPLSLLFILLLPITFFKNPIKTRLLSFLPVTSYSKNSPPADPSLIITPSENIRQIVWRGAIDLWRRYPIFGTGVETFAYTYYWTRPVEHNLTSEWEFIYNKAHNEYLNYLSTTGIVGLGSYLIFLLSPLIIIGKSLLKQKRWLPPLAEITLIASLLSLWITNFSGFSTVFTSLFLFLLPPLLLNSRSTPAPPTGKPVYSVPFLIKSVLIFVPTIYFGSKTAGFFLADISYANSLKTESQSLNTSRSFIKTSLSLRPSEPLYWSRLGQIDASIVATSTGNTTKIDPKPLVAEAIEACRKSLDISPANTSFWKEKAQVYYYLSSVDPVYFADSIKALDIVSRLAPTDPKTFYLLGRYYQSANLIDLALENYQIAVRLKSNYDHPLFAIAKIYLDQKKPSQAKPLLEKVILINPKNQEAKDLLSKI